MIWNGLGDVGQGSACPTTRLANDNRIFNESDKFLQPRNIGDQWPSRPPLGRTSTPLESMPEPSSEYDTIAPFRKPRFQVNQSAQPSIRRQVGLS